MWEYKGEEFTSDMIGDNYGFVYIIENKMTGQRYVGRKFFWSKRTLPPLKGKKRKRHVKKESDWKNYWSSSKVVKEQVEKLGKGEYRRIIVSLHPNKAETNYHELKLQMMLNVLDEVNRAGERKFLNDNINLRHYTSKNFTGHRQEMHEFYKELIT